MTYNELVQLVRDRFAETDVSYYSGVLAYQFNVTGSAEGIFYAEIKDGKLSIEPYEYNDHDAILHVSDKNLIKILNGTLNPVAAFTSGKLRIEGNIGKALELSRLLK